MTTERPLICILGATFNTENRGVSVLAAGALRCVLNRFPEARIIQLDYAQERYEFQFLYKHRSITVHFENIRFSKKFYLPNNIGLLILLTTAGMLVPFTSVRRQLLSYNRSLRTLFETDLVLSLAGGDSFSDIYGLRRLLYTSLPQILTILAGKRLVLLPQTIGPFRHRISKVIARYILTNAEVIYSRDQTGEKATRRLLGIGNNDTRVRFCYDLGFDVDPVHSPALTVSGLQKTLGSLVVGFNVSGLLMRGGYSHNNMFGLKADYDKLVFRLIQFLIEDKAATVLLIPHVFGSSTESDLTACEHVFTTLRSNYEGKLGLVRDEGDYGQLKHLIGQCDFFIGARMHACIAAVSQSVPAVSIAYSDKFIGVMETIGVRDLVVDPRTMDEDDIVTVVDYILTGRADVRCTLEQRMPRVKQTIQRALADVDIPRFDGSGKFAHPTDTRGRTASAPKTHA